MVKTSIFFPHFGQVYSYIGILTPKVGVIKGSPPETLDLAKSQLYRQIPASVLAENLVNVQLNNRVLSHDSSRYCRPPFLGLIFG